MINRTVLEKWLPIENYEEFYEISNLGDVRSKDRKVWNGRVFYIKKGRILRKTKTTTGYWKIELIDGNGKRKSLKIHRLVANEFIKKVDGKTLINHIDGDPLNNEVSNLEWCTQSENMQHAYDTGLMKSNFNKFKDKIITEYVKDESTDVRNLAKKYNCSDSSIRKLLRKERIEIRGLSHIQDIYKIDKKQLAKCIDQGMSNKEIAKLFQTNKGLIATYRHKYKRRMLKI